MKTIVRNSNNYSSYVFENDAEVTINSNNIVTPTFIIADLNSSNATMHENVTQPDDWIGNKYTFDGTTWAANPDWTEPTSEDIE